MKAAIRGLGKEVALVVASAVLQMAAKAAEEALKKARKKGGN